MTPQSPATVLPETAAFVSPEPQQLTQPLAHMMIGFGFLSPRYKQLGVVTTSSGARIDHYGVDWWQATGTSKDFLSPGDGVVVLAGANDRTFGNLIVLRYDDCMSRRGERADIVVRCYHLERILCRTGQIIRRGDALGVIGTTGLYSSGVHAHVECSLRVDRPTAVPGINPTQYLQAIKRVESGISDPADWIWTGKGQTAMSAGNYYRDAGHGDNFMPARI